MNMIVRNWHIAYGAATLLTALCFAIGLPMGWLQSLNWFEVAAVYTSFACTILCNYQDRSNYPVGIVSQLLYSYVFWTSGMYALASFNLYLVGSLTYGYFFWKDNPALVPVTRVASLKNWLGYASFGILILALFYGSVYILEPANLALVSPMDAGIAALSGVAQLLLDRKRIETWYVWTVVNLISIPYYYSVGYYFFAFQYVIFLVNIGIGYMAWKKSMETSNLNDNIPSDLSPDRSGDIHPLRVG